MSITRVLDQSKGPPAHPDDAANYWLARRNLRLTTQREETAFEAWRADPVHGAAYAKAESVLEGVDTLAAHAEIRQMREAALSVGPARTRVPLAWRFGAAAAGVLAIALGVSLWIEHSSSDYGTTLATVGGEGGSSAPAVKHYATKLGQQSNLVLEDGSTVSLNTDSVLEVSYSPARREIALLQGQALFHVAKNEHRPFVVTAGDRRVTALGTAFDVRVDQSGMKVVLVEGRISIDPMKRSGIERIIPALGREELEPGEQLISAVNHPVAVTVADVDRATSWSRGQVIFRDDTLAAAIAEMNRYSATQFVIDDPRVASLHVSGVFSVSRPEHFLAALTAFYPIDAQRRSPNVSVLVWRQD